MSDLIALTLVVDAEAALSATSAPSQDPESPQILADETCFVIASTADTLAGQATRALTLRAQQAPRLDWRSLSFLNNAGAGIYLYRVRPVVPPTSDPPPVAHHRSRMVPVPRLLRGKQEDPPAFTVVEASDYFLRTSPLEKGEYRFETCFYITAQDSDGRPVPAGYFGCAVDVSIG